MCGLPIKDFVTVEKFVARALGKHHRKSHKPKMINYISSVFQLLHMDLFGPVHVLSLSRSSYCLVITDDYSRFTWVFFLSNKSKTTELIKKFVVLMENQLNLKLKGIRCDNGTQFKNAVLNHFCSERGGAPSVGVSKIRVGPLKPNYPTLKTLNMGRVKGI